MVATTVKINPETKSKLDLFREYKNETYDEIINKLVFIINKFKEEPELGLETIEAIRNARERIKQGNFLTEEEARKRLGF